jgi:hypothetical protein
MKPVIDKTRFGSITIAGETYDYDVIIRLDGEVKKRKKKLSKAVFGSSHTLSKDEAKYVYAEGAERIIIGSGQSGVLDISEEAEAYFRKKGCSVDTCRTPEAVRKWNEARERVIGLFHVTC